MAENHLITNLVTAQRLTGNQQLTSDVFRRKIRINEVAQRIYTSKVYQTLVEKKFSLTDNGAVFAGFSKMPLAFKHFDGATIGTQPRRVTGGTTVC